MILAAILSFSLRFIIFLTVLYPHDNADILTGSTPYETEVPAIQFDRLPANLQLYPRDNQDSAVVQISGTVNNTGYDSIYVIVYKNNVFCNKRISGLNYSGNSARFVLLPKIHAELSEYSFAVFLKNNSSNYPIAFRDSIVCGDVFLINGQSNAHPGSNLANYRNEFCRSFGKNTDYSSYNPADTLWGLASGDDAINFHTGVWGIKLQQLIKETYSIPVCIINGGSGGSSIQYNLRNNNNHMDLNTTYGRLLYRTYKAGLINNIKAVLWYQGEQNTDASWINYDNNFRLLYSAWAENYPGLQKVYVFQIHHGCGGNLQWQLREVQRNFQQKYKNVEVISTMGIPGHDGCHYDFQGYNRLGEIVFRLIARDFYKSTDTSDISSPDIKSIFFTSLQKTTIALVFSKTEQIVWQNDTLGKSLLNYFYLDNAIYGNIASYRISKDTLFLNFTTPVYAVKMSYLPNSCYNGSNIVYQGPYLKNSRGLGMLSFYNFPISSMPVAGNNEIPLEYKVFLNYPNPFNLSTSLKYELPEYSLLKMDLFDSRGVYIKNIINKEHKPGTYETMLTADDISSGVYFIRFRANNFRQTLKIVVLK